MTVRPDRLERLRVVFFRAFFTLLLASIAIAEWAVVARLLDRLGLPPPWPLHLVVPPVVWVVNRRIAMRLRATTLMWRRPPRPSKPRQSPAHQSML